jgi:hypothetical protein
MYRDQHSIESLGTARVITSHAYDYTDYLYAVLGREFVLAEPIEFRGTDRLRVKFVSRKAADGERSGPFVEMIVEYNPAMGLYTVTGKYWSYDGAPEPAYQSSPRSGVDDEMLADPARMFDWLTAVSSAGKPVYAAYEGIVDTLESLLTPAGRISLEEMDYNSEDDACVMCMEPEYRVPRDYFVSGTHFGTSQAKPYEVWMDTYANPVRNSIQNTLNNLYGVGVFDVEIDAEGFAYVTFMGADLSQGSRSVPKNHFESEILRMAGVDGRVKYADRSLNEAWYDSGTVIDVSDKPKKKQPPPKFQMKVKDADNLAAFNQLVNKLKAQKKAGKNIRDPEALAGWIGMRMAGRKARAGRKSAEESVSTDLESLLLRLEGEAMVCEGCGCDLEMEEAKQMGDGTYLCEKCCAEMEESAEYASDSLDEALSAEEEEIIDSFAVSGKSDGETIDDASQIPTLKQVRKSAKEMGVEEFGFDKKALTPAILDAAAKAYHDAYVKAANKWLKSHGKSEIEESGEKYKKLVASLKKKGADDPKALAAWIGMKKLGKKEFLKRAAAGRKAAKKKD